MNLYDDPGGITAISPGSLRQQRTRGSEPNTSIRSRRDRSIVDVVIAAIPPGSANNLLDRNPGCAAARRPGANGCESSGFKAVASTSCKSKCSTLTVLGADSRVRIDRFSPHLTAKTMSFGILLLQNLLVLAEGKS